MSFQALLIALKGSARSGNFGHEGRPGRVGGSALGGGHGRIGVTSETPTEEVRIHSTIYNKHRNFPYAKDEDFDYQHVKTLPGMYDAREYTSNNYSPINKCLRAIKPCSDSINASVEEMGKFFKALPPLRQNVTVNRLISQAALGGQAIQPGDVIVDKAFVSTTIDKSSGASKGEVNIEIYVPKGSKAAYLKPISHYSNENELLINRDAKFKIIDVQRNSKNAITNIVAEYLK